MGKTISATHLRQNLGQLLDELAAGQTHFVVERNHQPAAVLMSAEKFAEIRRMLELIAVQDYIRPEPSPSRTMSRIPVEAKLPPPAAALAERARAYYAEQQDTHTDTSLSGMTSRLGLRIVR